MVVSSFSDSAAQLHASVPLFEFLSVSLCPRSAHTPPPPFPFPFDPVHMATAAILSTTNVARSSRIPRHRDPSIACDHRIPALTPVLPVTTRLNHLIQTRRNILLLHVRARKQELIPQADLKPAQCHRVRRVRREFHPQVVEDIARHDVLRELVRHLLHVGGRERRRVGCYEGVACERRLRGRGWREYEQSWEEAQEAAQLEFGCGDEHGWGPGNGFGFGFGFGFLGKRVLRVER